MQKSDLLHVFLSLSEDEISEGKKFLQSPFFNKRKDVIALFDFLVHTSKKNKKDWSKEKAFTFIFPKTTYNDAQIRHTMSYLLQLLYQFLSLNIWQSDPIRQSLDLHKSLRVRNLEKQSERKICEIEIQIAQEPLRDIQHHFHKYIWQLERYAVVHKRRRTGDMHLQEISENFNIYYLAEALRQGCLLLSHQNLSKQNYDFTFFEELLVWVKRKGLERTSAVAVYYHSYIALTNPDQKEHFFELKKLLTNDWAAFPQEEIRDLYLLAINYCIKQQNKGNIAFVKEGFSLYQVGLEHGILLENGILSVYAYKNIHLLADKLGEYDWIVTFLEKYRDFLPAEQRENHYNFNIAQYFFRRKKYEKAMPMLQTIEFSDVLHNLDARKMLLIMYYDLKEFDAFDALIDSFRTYLLRQKDLGYHKESFTNLLKFSKKLLLLTSMSKAEKEIFKQEINGCNILAEKSWLLEQCR